MNVGPVAGPLLQAAQFRQPALTPEEMVTIAAARPAVLHQQGVALAAMNNGPNSNPNSGTTGQGTPGIEADGHIDILA